LRERCGPGRNTGKGRSWIRSRHNRLINTGNPKVPAASLDGRCSIAQYPNALRLQRRGNLFRSAPLTGIVISQHGISPEWNATDKLTQNFSSRPYALGPDYYDRFRPAYRYGFESARDHLGRSWDDAEPDLREGWSRYQHESGSPSAWEEIKGAVRDAWNRVTGGRTAGDEARGPQIRE